MANFSAMTLVDWQRFETALSRTDESNLIYALRVASVVPALKSMKTLGRRSFNVQCGAGSRGLALANDGALKRDVAEFIDWLFRKRVDDLLREKFHRYVLRGAKAPSEAAKEKLLSVADAAMAEPLAEIDMPGIPAMVEQWRASMRAAILTARR
ncbi:MAG: hypothetical protein ACR2OZ_10755 [Verrucomicrobiales bacterium]